MNQVLLQVPNQFFCPTIALSDTTSSSKREVINLLPSTTTLLIIELRLKGGNKQDNIDDYYGMMNKITVETVTEEKLKDDLSAANINDDSKSDTK